MFARRLAPQNPRAITDRPYDFYQTNTCSCFSCSKKVKWERQYNPNHQKSGAVMKLNEKNITESILGWAFAAIGLVCVVIEVVFIISFDRFAQEEMPFFVPIMMAFMTLIFGGFGFFFLRRGSKSRKRQKRLMRDGISYDAEITEAYYKSAYQVNGRSPLVVECRYVDRHGGRYLVKSGNLWPKMTVDMNTLRATVFANPENPKDYYVEVTSEDPYWADTHDLR